jgi:hypothetical protein
VKAAKKKKDKKSEGVIEKSAANSSTNDENPLMQLLSMKWAAVLKYSGPDNLWRVNEPALSHWYRALLEQALLNRSKACLVLATVLVPASRNPKSLLHMKEANWEFGFKTILMVSGPWYALKNYSACACYDLHDNS